MNDLRTLPLFSRAPWQMSYGERAALEGLLRVLQPRLSIEVGRAEGGSLRRVAVHSEHVISFDVVDATDEVAAIPNATILVGDSHRMLREQLAALATEGRSVDFALIDGDHSADGVRADMVDIIESPAVRRCVILAHDSLNEHVRAGLEDVPYERYRKVAFVDLDFVPGFVARLESDRGHCWGGLGLVVVDESRSFVEGALRNQTLFPHPEVVWSWARAEREGRMGSTTAPSGASGQGSAAAAEIARLQAELDAVRIELERNRGWLQSIQASVSWRVTAPLRNAKRRLLRP